MLPRSTVVTAFVGHFFAHCFYFYFLGVIARGRKQIYKPKFGLYLILHEIAVFYKFKICIKQNAHIRCSYLNCSTTIFFCTFFIKAKQLQENIENDDYSFGSKEQHEEAIDAMASDMEEIKNHLVDDNMVVKKGTSGISVKVFLQQ